MEEKQITLWTIAQMAVGLTLLFSSGYGIVMQSIGAANIAFALDTYLKR